MNVFDAFKSKMADILASPPSSLDRGIYKVMNYKREETIRFLEYELLRLVCELFASYEGDKGEVYDLVHGFFARYYDKGLLCSEAARCLPYNGEEVKLYWANYDQYYVRSCYRLFDYRFRTKSKRSVVFKIVEATIPKDDVKGVGKLCFFLRANEPVKEKDGRLEVYFVCLHDKEGRKQSTINKGLVETIITKLKEVGLDSWLQELTIKASGSRKSTLEKHLSSFTHQIRSGRFDYFIHKDLGKFLRRELDFYIKNEVMHLDDIENESAPRVEQYLSKIKVIRRIAHKIIDFLAQIEDFQKKLWLKKKFVVETNYCMTLDRVPPEFYPEIAENKAQLEEWEALYGLDAYEGELISLSSGVSVPPWCMLDTRHFDEEFKQRLLSAIEDLDERCDGLLVHSENFQALNLMLERYREQVKCIYIDPPYNTGNDEFVYKDKYRHSSWLAMMYSRMGMARYWMREDGAVFVSIDDGEQARLRELMELVFGEDNFVNNVIWQKKFSPQNDARWLSDNHDFLVCFAKCKTGWRPELLPRTCSQNRRYKNPDNDPRGPWMSSDLSVKTYSPDYDYPITTPSGRVVHPPEGRCWFTSRDNMEKLIADNRIWFGSDGKGVPRLKRFLAETKQGVTPLTIWPYKEVGHNQEGKQELKSTLLEEDLLFSTPKPVRLIRRVVMIGGGRTDLILDYFAGSGTTAHAVINLNREDGGRRKYILVEMGDYFDTVLMPRIKKVVYSKDWKNGKPVSHDTGISHMFKYIRLESYEDALANIELKRDEQKSLALGEDPLFRESYLLKYMIDVEAQGSPSLLNIDWFDDPFNYTLLIGTGSVGETRPVRVDLVETFNWLLGLRVHHIDHFREDGELKYVVVEGENPRGGKVLVIWRKIRDLTAMNAESAEEAARLRQKANEELDEFFRKQQYNTLDTEFDVIYVNGDNNLMNLPLAPEKEGVEPRYKVRLIEEEFKRLMFDVKDV